MAESNRKSLCACARRRTRRTPYPVPIFVPTLCYAASLAACRGGAKRGAGQSGKLPSARPGGAKTSMKRP
eukprot:scaffold202186_cov35-Tisochrysis_lutea.AAC.2